MKEFINEYGSVLVYGILASAIIAGLISLFFGMDDVIKNCMSTTLYTSIF